MKLKQLNNRNRNIISHIINDETTMILPSKDVIVENMPVNINNISTSELEQAIIENIPVPNDILDFIENLDEGIN